jgi:hypothetical protein
VGQLRERERERETGREGESGGDRHREAQRQRHTEKKRDRERNRESNTRISDLSSEQTLKNRQVLLEEDKRKNDARRTSLS